MKRIYAAVSGEPTDEKVENYLMPFFKFAMMDLYLGLAVEGTSTDERCFTDGKKLSPLFSVAYSREQLEQKFRNITIDLRRIKRSDKCLRRVHLKTETGDVYMELDNATDPYYECNVFNAYTLRLSEKEKFAEFSITTIKLVPGKEVVEIHNSVGGALSFFEGSERNAKGNMIWNKLNVPHPAVLSAIEDGMHAIRREINNTQFQPAQHSKMFGELIGYVIRETTEDGHAFEKMMTTYGTSEEKARPFMFYDYANPDVERIYLDDLSLDPFNFPFLDLSMRDVKWIIEYAGPQIQKRSFDHEAAINNCNYGRGFRFQLGAKNERYKLPIGLATYEENERGEICIKIREELPDYPGVSMMVKGFYESIDAFPESPSLVSVNSLIDYTTNLPLEADFCAASVIFNSDLVHLIGYMNYVMAVLIVLHDRPTKYVRIKEYADEETTPRERKKNTNGTSSQPRKLISHILKTQYQAKKLLSSIAGTKAERNYFVESWSRCAHTRRLKDGRIINVRGSECHRKKPLRRDGEVVLKL